VLVNNAGVGVANLNVWETEPSDWQWVHGVNVLGVVHGIQAFVPRMLASGEEGCVVNTSSGDGGISPLAGQSVYASSKAAVSILTVCLAAQLLATSTKLRAAIFYPSGGLLRTGIWTKAQPPAEWRASRRSPLARRPAFEEFMAGMKQAGVELPVQDLDEPARFTLMASCAATSCIMIGRRQIEAQPSLFFQ
jgi:NAD(P)-dependent dehydrogenase (short-subunit alcohol dehydrogenase family)